MRRALGELDQNNPIANGRSSRQCSARARDETPMRTRDAADGEGGTRTSVRRLNSAALDAAEALLRENRLTHHSRNSENHLTYAEALKRSGYVGDNGGGFEQENERRAGARSDELGGGHAHQYESNAR